MIFWRRIGFFKKLLKPPSDTINWFKKSKVIFRKSIINADSCDVYNFSYNSYFYFVKNFDNKGFFYEINFLFFISDFIIFLSFLNCFFTELFSIALRIKYGTDKFNGPNGIYFNTFIFFDDSEKEI